MTTVLETIPMLLLDPLPDGEIARLSQNHIEVMIIFHKVKTEVLTSGPSVVGVNRELSRSAVDYCTQNFSLKALNTLQIKSMNIRKIIGSWDKNLVVENKGEVQWIGDNAGPGNTDMGW